MAFMKTEQYESTPNILESEVGLVLKPTQQIRQMLKQLELRKLLKQVPYIQQMQQAQSALYLKMLI